MSKELNKTYDPKDIEDRLYKKWEDNGYFHAEVDRSRKPFTIVMPPPNITGQLHMGHALDNTMQDILIRYKRMQGYNADNNSKCWSTNFNCTSFTINFDKSTSSNTIFKRFSF